jgi:Uma2 family endonuclease
VEALQRTPMSWEEYLATPEHPRHEWVDGIVVVGPVATPDHQWISRRLANHLEAHLPGLFVFEAINVRLPGNRVRIPDIAVLTSRDHPRLVEATPVLVAEILSPSTRREDLVVKATEYLAGGIGQYWVVDPAHREVVVYRQSGGRWSEVPTYVDETRPTAEVSVGDHGVVPLDLRDVLDA